MLRKDRQVFSQAHYIAIHFQYIQISAVGASCPTVSLGQLQEWDICVDGKAQGLLSSELVHACTIRCQKRNSVSTVTEVILAAMTSSQVANTLINHKQQTARKETSCTDQTQQDSFKTMIGPGPIYSSSGYSQLLWPVYRQHTGEVLINDWYF